MFGITYCTGNNVLYHNNGDGTFTDVTAESGLLEQPGRVWNSGATWIDYNRDGHLDLFVASYLDFEPDRIPKPGASAFCRYMDVPVNCGPRGLTPTGHTLYRNNGDGTFSDVTDASGVGSIKAISYAHDGRGSRFTTTTGGQISISLATPRPAFYF